MIPAVTRRESPRIQHEEMEKKLHKVVLELYKQKELIQNAVIKLPKKTQAEVLEPITMAIREIESSIPFLLDSFGEHIENNLEKAKVEVHAYINNTINRAGLEALTNQPSEALLLE